MKKTCVIGVYFGKLPNYFSLWLKSCEFNSEIDFLLFTDNQLYKVPSNVYVYTMTLKEMKEKIEKKICFNISLEKPYKVCDYRPFFGILFEEYLKEYSYWAHCDFDMIFGDINFYQKKFQIEKYDKFLPFGHLSFYKNTKEVNDRYKINNGKLYYKKVFTTKKNCVFDELPGMIETYKIKKFPFFDKKIMMDITDIYKRFRQGKLTISDESVKNYKYQTFYWEKGKTYRAFWQNNCIQIEECIYIHFKKRPNFKVDFDIDNTKAYYITNKGFIKKDKDITLQEIKKLNPYYGVVYEFLEKQVYKIRQWGDFVKRHVFK